MILTEKVKFNGINKQVSPASINNGGDRQIINPIIDSLNFRFISSENGEELIGESIKGSNEIVNPLLPSGTNKVIGWCEDKQKNCIFYFVYNSNNNHCIFKYVPETNVITLVIQRTELKFNDDRKYLINSANIINDLLVWNDGLNQTGYINTTRSYSYTGFEEKHIRLNKIQPFLRPTVNITAHGTTDVKDDPSYYRSNNTNLSSNFITDKNYQFSYRYIFIDNEKSNLAPPSILSWGERFPDLTRNTDNQIIVNAIINDAMLFAKQIQFLYREGNEGTWKMFSTAAPSVSQNYTVTFGGTQMIEDIPESESLKLFELIPNFSSASCIQKNRLFVVDNESGFDGTNNPTLTITQNTIRHDILKSGWALGGRKKIGIAVFDENQHSIGVISPKEISFPFYPTFQKRENLLTKSFSTLSISFGAKTIVIAEKEIVSYTKIGDDIRVEDTANIGGFYMFGIVTSVNYNTGSVSFIATDINGSGTKSVWNVFLKGSLFNTPLGGHYRIDVSVVGTFAGFPRAKYYSIVSSDDQFYEEKIQIPARILFYKYDKTGDYEATSQEVIIDGKVFTKQLPSDSSAYSKVYVQIPRETPIVIDDSFYIRLLNIESKIEKILQVDGDFLIVNNFGKSDWSGVDTSYDGSSTTLVDIFRPKDESDRTIYFEITDRYVINNNGTVTVPSITDLGGDEYLMSNRYSFRSFKRKPAYLKNAVFDATIWSASPVGSLSTNTRDTFKRGSDREEITRLGLKVAGVDVGKLTKRSTDTEKRKKFLKRIEGNESKFSNDELDTIIKNILTSSDDTTSVSRNYVIDYSKKDWNKGFPLIEIDPQLRVFKSDTKIRFSNKLIQDTNINGLNSFDVGNSHSISNDRGKINRLIPVGDNILAVHERACTSLYIEEGIIKYANGGGALVTTDNVIGHDNKMLIEYGSYHGESVAKNDLNQVFGFDVYKGVVWRYTNAGLNSIVNNDMRDYFRKKGEEYLPIKDNCKIIGAIDPYHKEYIITFRKPDGSGDTWAYNYVAEVWCCRYSFIPEMYANIGNNLIAFNGGKLHKMNSSNAYTNFFGVQYGRFVKVAVNPFPGKKKVFNGIQIAAEKLSVDQDEIIVRVYSGSQESYCRLSEFDLKQGIYFGPILKDINTPNMEVGQMALRDGDDMRGDYLIVEIISSLPERLPIRFFNITYNVSEFSQ